MAKTSSIERNKKRIRLAKKFSARRTRLKAIANDESLPPEQRFAARLKLSELPRNASPKFKLSRIALRELASTGQIPGMVKSSW